MMNDLRTVKLTIISDLVCPWCFIGHRELEEATRQVAALPLHFEIEYRPYRINQAISDEQPPMNRVTFMQNKYGKDKWDTMTAMATQRGQQLGINFAWGGKFSQTTRAHRLLLRAWQVGGQDLQRRLIELLFQAYFEQNEDIGDMDMLADRAERAGLMTRDAALDYLDSDDNVDEVTQMMEEARINGVTGVPFTVIDGKWAVSGGQTADVYVQIFQKLAACHIQELRTPKPMQVQPPVVTMAA